MNTNNRSHKDIGTANVRKGKAFERRVAKLLTDWSGTEFRRRRVEGRDNATLYINSTADVIPVTALNFPFSIEVKSGSGFSINAILNNPIDCVFGQYWFQTCYDSKLISDIKHQTIYPMLIFKPIPAYTWIAISGNAISLLQPYNIDHNYVANNKLWFPHLRIDEYGRIISKGNISHSPKHKQIITMQLEPVIISQWSIFATNVNPASLII